MNLSRLWFVRLYLVLLVVAGFDSVSVAEPKVQILSPKDGSRITQDQKSIFVNGKVARDAGRSANVDIFLVIDISGSTAMYAGADLGDADQPPESSGFGMPQISIGGTPPSNAGSTIFVFDTVLKHFTTCASGR